MACVWIPKPDTVAGDLLHHDEVPGANVSDDRTVLLRSRFAQQPDVALAHFRLEAEGETEIRRAMNRMNELRNDFFKVMVTGGGTPGTDPRRSQYSAEELAVMVDEARRSGKQITCHAHGTEGIRLAVDAGFDGVEHCTWLAREGHEYDYDESVVSRMVERGTVVCKTIAGFERWPVEELGPHHEKWDAFEPYRRMIRAGVRMVAGTDAGIDLTDFSGLSRTLETMIGLGGMSVEQAIASATRDAAEALGLGEETGTLSPGKYADCIGVAGNPYEDIRVLREVGAVVCRGELAAHTRSTTRGVQAAV